MVYIGGFVSYCSQIKSYTKKIYKHILVPLSSSFTRHEIVQKQSHVCLYIVIYFNSKEVTVCLVASQHSL